MFKDKFKEANDSIHADEELINKVLALKNPENRIIVGENGKKRRKPIVTYIPAAAAAVIVISAAITSIPFITKTKDNSGVIFESTVTESSDTLAEDNDILVENKLQEASEPVASSSPESSTNAAIPESGSVVNRKAQNSTTSQKEASVNTNAKRESSDTENSSSAAHGGSAAHGDSASHSESGYDDTIPVEEYDLPTSQKSRSTDIPDNADISGIPKQVTPPQMTPPQAAQKADTSEERVVLSMNTGAYAQDFSAAITAAVPLALEVGYAEWRYRDYFDYLGRNLAPALPSDFRLTGHDSDSVTDEAFLAESFEMAVDEYGTPVFDNRIFVFDGSDGRYVGIQTSRDTNTAMTYLTDSSFTLSKIGGSHGVLIGTIEDCRAYMICGGVSYVINATGLNEDELKTLLLSVAQD